MYAIHLFFSKNIQKSPKIWACHIIDHREFVISSDNNSVLPLIGKSYACKQNLSDIYPFFVVSAFRLNKEAKFYEHKECGNLIFYQGYPLKATFRKRIF